MALNKVLEGMLNDFKKDFLLEIPEISKQFEYLVNYLVVSKFHPDAFSDKGDLERVVVDEKGQFGLDAIAFIVNGNLVLGKDDISINRSDSFRYILQLLFWQNDRPEAKRNTDRSDWKRKDRNGKSDRTDDESGHTVGSGT